MAHKINVKKILERNPHISEEDIQIDQKISEDLKKEGLQPRGYRLAPPFERKQATLAGGDDPRIINLTKK